MLEMALSPSGIGGRDADVLISTRFSPLLVGAPFTKRFRMNGGDDGTRTRDLCRDSLGIYVLSATYILAGAAKSLKRTVGTVPCG